MLFHPRPFQRAGCAGRRACDPGPLPAIPLSELERAGEVWRPESDQSSGWWTPRGGIGGAPAALGPRSPDVARLGWGIGGGGQTCVAPVGSLTLGDPRVSLSLQEGLRKSPGGCGPWD